MELQFLLNKNTDALVTSPKGGRRCVNGKVTCHRINCQILKFEKYLSEIFWEIKYLKQLKYYLKLLKLSEC